MGTIEDKQTTCLFLGNVPITITSFDYILVVFSFGFLGTRIFGSMT